jgi:DNA repair exonuclease SbcCD ATPase subunit
MTDSAVATRSGAEKRAQALRDARRRDSETKRAHVRHTVENMLVAGETVTFASVARRSRVSTWLVYADGVREHIQTAIRQQARQPTEDGNIDHASDASLRTDLAHAREEIKRLRGDNEKLRRNTQRLLGQQLDQANVGDLIARINTLVDENRRLTAELHQATAECTDLRCKLTELEEDVAAARTALRRMMREQTADLGDNVEPDR